MPNKAQIVGHAAWHVVEGAPRDELVGCQLRVDILSQDGSRTSLALGAVRRGLSPIVLSLPAHARRIAIVAATPDGDIDAPEYALRRVGRARAVWLMLLGAPDEHGRRAPANWAHNLRLLVRPLTRGRVRQAIYLLASTYLASLRANVNSTDPVVPCDLMSGRGRARPTVWRPVNNLHPATQACGVVEWEATGEDPQFRLERSGLPVMLRAGWYRIEIATSVRSGKLVAPALYPDYGTGCQAYDLLALPEPDGAGRIRALVLLKADVASLRFDPSVRLACFRIEASSLQRVGRLRALVSMLDRFRHSDGRRDWRGAAAALAGFLGDAPRMGLSAAASRLHHGRGTADAGADYAQWVRLYDTFDNSDLLMMRERAAGLPNQPLVSVILPVYETPATLLKRCLDSVLAQAYSNWELCIVDDASPSPHVTAVLGEYAKQDPRIRFTRRDVNGHISAASNDALAMARGDYVALLDHDDELRPHALLEMVELFTGHDRIALAYSDEDKIDERGRRFQPNFKPDWNPDLLLSQNYMCHFTMARTDLVRKAGGFRVGYEGSQDHDLFLRCIEHLSPDQIGHIPKVLYHWRAVTGSTALERGAKDYASAAGAKAVADHLSRIAPGATAEELAHGHYRVRWPLPVPAPKVSIIVPTRDRLELLRTCVDSVLAKSTYPDFEILIVDNQSVEAETLSWLAQAPADPRVRVLRYDAPFNYSAINNWAASFAAGEVLCLLNNDIEVVTPDWLEVLVGHAVRPDVGAVGAMLFYPDATIQHAGVILGLGGVANHIYSGMPAGTAGHGARALVAQNMSAVTGACLVVRKSLYQQVGGLEEELQVAFNDIDFCLRLREAGYWNLWTPFAELVHHESASRGRDESEDKRARFLREVAYMERRWGACLNMDPAYSPNLSLDDLGASLASPPRIGN